MRKRYTHTNPLKLFRICNRFSHSNHNETVHSYDYNDFNNVLFDKDVDMQDIINDDNEFDYDNERIFFEENNVITKSSNNNDEEKSNDEEEPNNDEEEESNNNEEEEPNNGKEVLY